MLLVFNTIILISCFNNWYTHIINIFFIKWIFIYNLVVNFAIIVSKLELIICTVLIIVTCYILIYSVNYLEVDVNIFNFISLLLLFTISMIISVAANNWITFFIGWETLGLISYFLINYWNTRIEANKSALKALLWNKIGDLFLLYAIINIWFIFKSYNFIIMNFSITYIKSNFILYSMTICILIAIFIKSVQFILNIWILDAQINYTI